MRTTAGVLALLAAAGLVTGVLLGSTAPSQFPFIAVGLAPTALGWLIAARRPDIGYGWLLLATACCLGLGMLGAGLLYRYEWGPGALPGSLYTVYYGLQWIYVPLLFPAGRLPSPRWRPVAWLGAVAIALQWAGYLLMPPTVLGLPHPFSLSGTPGVIAMFANGLGQLTVIILALVVIGGLIARRRRAAREQRRQFTWVIGGAVLNLVGFGLVGAFLTGGGAALAMTGLIAMVGSLPAAIAVAVVRYRLLDIRVGLRGARLFLVFDLRPTVTELLSELAPALQDAEPGEQLAGLAGAVRAGLDARWVAVTFADGGTFCSGTRDGAAALTLPVAGGLGELACGPKNHGRFTGDDRRLLEAFAAPVGLAIQSAALATRLVNAQEAERRRLERNIHDGVQQQLVALIAGLELARASGSGQEMLPLLREQARQTLDDLRELAAGIHPSVLGQGGLVEAVESRCARLPVHTVVSADAGLRAERFTDEVEGALYFTVSEALANALKHASADKIEVRLSRGERRLHASVSDDGTGFEPVAGSLGALADRLRALGGGLDVTSEEGKGTRVSAWVPAHG